MKFRILVEYQGMLEELGIVEADDKKQALQKAPELSGWEYVPAGSLFKAERIEDDQ